MLMKRKEVLKLRGVHELLVFYFRSEWFSAGRPTAHIIIFFSFLVFTQVKSNVLIAIAKLGGTTGPGQGVFLSLPSFQLLYTSFILWAIILTKFCESYLQSIFI
jgi:hypothetical protein